MDEHKTERELHSTHEMVVGLHARFDNLLTRIEELHKEHGELRERVSGLDGRLGVIESVSVIQQNANAEARAGIEKVVGALETRMDKLMLGVMVTLLSVVGSMGILLYNMVWAAATSGY